MFTQSDPGFSLPPLKPSAYNGPTYHQGLMWMRMEKWICQLWNAPTANFRWKRDLYWMKYMGGENLQAGLGENPKKAFCRVLSLRTRFGKQSHHIAVHPVAFSKCMQSVNLSKMQWLWEQSSYIAWLPPDFFRSPVALKAICRCVKAIYLHSPIHTLHLLFKVAGWFIRSLFNGYWHTNPAILIFNHINCICKTSLKRSGGSGGLDRFQ